MAIINNLPAGGSSDYSQDMLPIYFYPQNLPGGYYYYVNSLSFYKYGDNTISIGSGSPNYVINKGYGIRFTPIIDFTASYNDSNGTAQTYTFKKGKLYEICHYMQNSTYYYKLYENDTSKASYSSATNRWGNPSNKIGILSNITW